MRNKRSVQVPHPENRVLFELTTISNELCRENMTTVQTSIIPQSNKSRKQGAEDPLDFKHYQRPGSSERPLLQKPYEPERPTMPFTVSSHEDLQPPQPQPRRDLSEPSRQSAANLNAAYREVVMNAARKQLGMANDPSRDSC